MRRDLHVMEQFCYLGGQELVKAQAPLHSAAPRDASRHRKERGVLRESSRPLGELFILLGMSGIDE
jgi:hypothetical protein